MVKSSLKSFKHISICNSPDPAIICSPLSSVYVWTKGSDYANLLRPSTNFGRSAGFFGLTATLTTGDTLYFIFLIGWASGWSLIVPVFSRY